MNRLLKLPRLATSAFSTTTKQMKNKVPDHQKLFQADNGLPVHIKGGTTDVLLYRLTMSITLAGTCYIPPSTHSVHLEYCGAGFLCRITCSNHCVFLFYLGTGYCLFWILCACQPKGK
uniref:Cytochrome c oxidase subunit 7A1, mitochondrial n=1 Tax=Oncorhynchus kisutch TaxID=8019 RepID=A0A8C7JUH5_ONCKI